MLSVVKQPKYIEKLVTLPNGKVVLVVFELISQNGRIIAKAISGKVVTEVFSQEEILCLPCVKTSSDFVPVKSTIYHLLSTFVRDFSFTMSQPTRAPSL
ncbi:MAG: hypothetical protein WCO10_01105 [bacterium]